MAEPRSPKQIYRSGFIWIATGAADAATGASAFLISNYDGLFQLKFTFQQIKFLM